MKHLICANTPAHVHLYRNAVDRLRARDHEVLVLARDYECTVSLCRHYDLPFVVYGANGTSPTSIALALPAQFVGIARHARGFDPDVVFGRGAYAAFAGAITDATTILLLDSNPWDLGIELPARLADSAVTTNAFEPDLGAHHYRFHGLTECAYLHPEQRSPDPSVRDALGVDPDERYAIVRFNAFDALHDVGDSGFTPDQQRDLIDALADHLTVFVSDEDGSLALSTLPAREYDLPPARIHDALAEASLFVGDTGTMVTEAALLGTPSVRASQASDGADLGEFVELDREGLIRNRQPDAVIDEARSLAADEDAEERWQTRRERFLADRVNLTDLIVRIAERPDAVPQIVSESARADDETQPQAGAD